MRNRNSLNSATIDTQVVYRMMMEVCSSLVLVVSWYGIQIDDVIHDSVGDVELEK